MSQFSLILPQARWYQMFQSSACIHCWAPPLMLKNQPDRTGQPCFAQIRCQKRVAGHRRLMLQQNMCACSRAMCCTGNIGLTSERALAADGAHRRRMGTGGRDAQPRHRARRVCVHLHHQRLQARLPGACPPAVKPRPVCRPDARLKIGRSLTELQLKLDRVGRCARYLRTLLHVEWCSSVCSKLLWPARLTVLPQSGRCWRRRMWLGRLLWGVLGGAFRVLGFTSEGDAFQWVWRRGWAHVLTQETDGKFPGMLNDAFHSLQKHRRQRTWRRSWTKIPVCLGI